MREKKVDTVENHDHEYYRNLAVNVRGVLTSPYVFAAAFTSVGFFRSLFPLHLIYSGRKQQIEISRSSGGEKRTRHTPSLSHCLHLYPSFTVTMESIACYNFSFFRVRCSICSEAGRVLITSGAHGNQST